MQELPLTQNEKLFRRVVLLENYIKQQELLHERRIRTITALRNTVKSLETDKLDLMEILKNFKVQTGIEKPGVREHKLNQQICNLKKDVEKHSTRADILDKELKVWKDFIREKLPVEIKEGYERIEALRLGKTI